MSNDKPATANPYVGPRTFTYADRTRFFGREREARDLLARVVSERLLLFYAQSGAGKSSLLHTRLIPQLREEERFVVLPVGRVSGTVPAAVQSVANPYLFNLMASLDQSDFNPQQLARLSLSHFLARLTSMDGVHWQYDAQATTPDTTLAHSPADPSLPDNAPGLDAALTAAPVATDSALTVDAGVVPSSAAAARYLLIIDQFEEIITAHTHRRGEREEFFRQLNQALLDDPQLWVVLTLRADYVAALDPYAHLLADKLRARFYMERMSVDAALAAVKEPAALAGRPFAAGVAEALVDNLRRIKGATPDEEQLGEYVEPVQLQVVCYQLWQKLHPQGAAVAPPPARPITYADLQQAGDVDRALAAFYEDALHAALALPAADISERQLRAWFDDVLITAAGTRGTVYQGESRTAEIPNAVVELLQQRFLLRAELRAGSAWIELIHDRLVAPIVENNRAWLQRQTMLLRAAQRWADGGCHADLLYSEAQLEEALKEADTTQHDALVHNFVEASRAKITAYTLRRRVFRLGLAALLSMVVTTVVFILWTTTRIARNEAVQARDSVQRLRVATEALIQRERAPQRALLLAVEATNLLDPATGHAEPQAFQALYSQFTQWEQWQQTLLAHTERVNGVQFGNSALDGADEVLYSVAADERLLRWAIPSGAVAELHRVNQGISAFAHHRATQQLALGTQAGELLLLGPTDGYRRAQRWQVYANGESLTALAFTPDGETVITGGRNGQIYFWAIRAPLTPTLVLTLPGQERCVQVCSVRALALSPDGQWLAAGGENHRLTVWHLAAGAEPTVVVDEAFIETVWAAAFSHDGNWLAAGDGTGALQLYGFGESAQAGTSPTPEQPPLTDLTDIRALAFSPVAPRLAIGDGSGLVGLLAVAEEPTALQVLGRLDHEIARQPINAVAFNATGTRVASGGMDGSIRLWQLDAVQQEPQELHRHTERVRTLALYPGPLVASQPPGVDTLISAGEDGTVQFWSMTTPPSHLGTVVEVGNQILASAIDPTGTWLATGGRDGQLRLYRLSGSLPAAPQLLGAAAGEIAAIAFSPAGDRLAVGGMDSRIYLWSLADLRQPAAVLPNESLILALAFDQAGTRLAAGDALWVKIWDLQQAPPTAARLYEHRDWVRSVAFEPNEQFVASISDNSMVHLAPLQGQAAAGPTAAHEQRGRAVAFAPDGTLLATAGDDGFVRLWNPANLAKPLAELQGHRGIVYALRFRSNGKALLSAGADGIIRQWTVDLPTLQAMACARVGRNLTPAEWALYFPSTPVHATCPALE